MQRNNVYWNTNIKLLLTNIGNVGLFIGLILFAHTANHKYLYFSMSLDLICQLVTWRFLIKDGIHFGLANEDVLTSALRSEMSVFTGKILLIGLFVLTEYVKSKVIGWFAILLILNLLSDLNSTTYTSPFDSFFNLINLITVGLFLLRYHESISMTWTTVLALQQVYAYAFFVIMCLSLAFWILTMISKLFSSTIPITWIQITYNLLYSASVLVYSMEIFALQGLLDGYTAWVGINLFHCSIACTVIFVLHTALGLCLWNIALPANNFAEREHGVIENTNMNYMINLVQSSPTMFVSQSVGGAQTTKPYEQAEDDLCFVCITNKPNCVMSPCLHGGLCSDCAKEWMKKNPTCSHCREKIMKVLVIEQKSPSEYLVTGEIISEI